MENKADITIPEKLGTALSEKLMLNENDGIDAVRDILLIKDTIISIAEHEDEGDMHGSIMACGQKIGISEYYRSDDAVSDDVKIHSSRMKEPYNTVPKVIA